MNYLAADTLGSPRVNTDVAGDVVARQDYMPFGEEISSSDRSVALGYSLDSIRQKFTGYQRDDESLLDFAMARSYSSALGRFFELTL